MAEAARQPAARSARSSPNRRTPLNREQVIQAGLAYADRHGLEALSLHKLAETLGVRAMSLYNHVKSKADLLDGMVDALWSEIEQRLRPGGDWQTALRELVTSIRGVVRDHPNIGSLLLTRQVLPVPALRAFNAVLTTLRESGFSDRDAVESTRTIGSYALGGALSELQWSGGQQPETELQRLRRVSQALPPDTPDELLGVAFKLCGEPDLSEPFERGLKLILDGLHSAHEGQETLERDATVSRPSV